MKTDVRNKKVVVGMSGGVDSAATAYLLQKAGYEVIGTTLRLWENGRFTLRQGKDAGKDQSYMLAKLTQEQLARTILPLGEITKKEVWDIAEKTQIVAADRTESQEICFVTQGSYADYLAQTVPNFPAGDIVDEAGNVLGRHKGIIHYTVGQRKGLGLAQGYPVYVKEIRAATNEIVVGKEASLYAAEISCNRLSFMGIADLAYGQKIAATVKIRYRNGGERATIERTGDDTAKIIFARPVRAPAPGQTAVFYDDGGCIIGGGTIF